MSAEQPDFECCVPQEFKLQNAPNNFSDKDVSSNRCYGSLDFGGYGFRVHVEGSNVFVRDAIAVFIRRASGKQRLFDCTLR